MADREIIPCFNKPRQPIRRDPTEHTRGGGDFSLRLGPMENLNRDLFRWGGSPIAGSPHQLQIESMYNVENLAQLKKMDRLAPQAMKDFWAFDQAAVAEGAIPIKYKELIAVAVALTTQCPY